MSTPAWLERGRIPSLDGVRAVAISLVMLSHWKFPFSDRAVPHAVAWRSGHLGVQLFFVLSGFLITTLMLREVARTGRLSLRQFYLRRVLRIVPAYLAYLAALAVLQACGQAALSAGDWLTVATYTANFRPVPASSHLWTLSVEEHFYLVWPLLVAALPLSRCRAAAVFGVGAALAVRWLLLLAFPGDDLPARRWTFARVDDFAAGALLAFLAREPAWAGRLDRLVGSNGRLALVLAAFLGSQLVCSPAFAGRLLGPAPAALLVSLGNDVAAFAVVVFLWAAVARPDSAAGRVLNHRAAVGLGVLSYSLYLWQQLFFMSPSPVIHSFPLNFLGSFLAAGLSYRLVERPFLALKDRLGAAGPAKAPPAPAGARPVLPAA
jgi:peptidoglycan/LPS O-acetylase OafA/YrhL